MREIAIGLAFLVLSGCAGQQIQLPPQPTPISIQDVNTQVAAISTDPTTTFHNGVMSVRAACQVYLNQEASLAAHTNQLGVAGGSLGAGLSIINPAAGVASSLFQTFLTAYQQAGVMPYNNETSGAIIAAMDAYEANAGTPSDNGTAVSWVDDVWFQCTPAGSAQIVSKAISTANIGVVATPSLSFIAPLAPTRRGRPVITVNGH